MAASPLTLFPMRYRCGAQEFVAICAHLPTELKDDLKKVAELSEETHRLTAELSRDQVEILERAKEKYRQVCCLYVCVCVCVCVCVWWVRTYVLPRKLKFCSSRR